MSHTIPEQMPLDMAACEELMRGGSKSFFAASSLLPQRIRTAAIALYAFCRVADDAIDLHPDDPEAMLRHTEIARKQKISFVADPSQQMARMDGEQIKRLIEGAQYLFLNEYELALAIQKTGWTDGEILDRVVYRIVTLGSEGSKVEQKGFAPIVVGVAQEKAKIDPTGVGDAYRSGFIAGLAWGLNHERCAQMGSMLATYVIETKGTQEYRFTRKEFLERFEGAFGTACAKDLSEHVAHFGFDA
jgi:adenosine kinase